MNERFDILTGEALRMYRIRYNLSQNDVAEKMNKTRQWISNIENGTRSVYWKDMQKLCRLYGIEPKDIGDYIDARL